MSRFNGSIEIDINDAIATFDCVAGVVYQDSEDDDQLLMPHFTMPQCFVVDCDLIEKSSGHILGQFPFSTQRLSYAVRYLND